MDWTRSGIAHRMEFYLVDSRTLEEVEPLMGVTSFSLAESWRGDYRQTGGIDIDGERLPLWAAVRAYLVSELDGEVVREELCTLNPVPAPIETRYGRELVSYDLYSSLRKLGTDLAPRDVGVPTGTSVSSHFSQVVEASGAVAYVHPGCTGYSTRSPRVWEAGDSHLKEAHAMADACGGRVEPDSHGRVCLVPYINPAQVAESFEVPGGAASVTLPGITEAEAEVVNRVVATYSQDDVRYYASATVDPTHPWSFERIGRWETLKASPPQVAQGASVQAVLDALVARTLKERSDVSRTWSASMLYMPVRVGSSGVMWYVDTDESKPLELHGFVSAREIKAEGASVRMEIVMEKV